MLYAQILESVSIPSILQLSHLSLNPLSFTHPSNVHYPCYSYLPRPLNTLQSKACHITPWRTFFSRQGLFPTVLEHPIDTGYFIYTSLACLGKEVQKLAHGEFIGLSLLLEDVLQDSELELTPSSPLHTDHNIRSVTGITHLVGKVSWTRLAIIKLPHKKMTYSCPV